MAKQKKQFYCTSCGNTTAKWSGQCPECAEWNTIVEAEPQSSGGSGKHKPESFRLSKIEPGELKRMATGIGEFDLACGGGIVPGSVILIGGEPGIGKSTIALQIASALNTLYISGEESAVQIRHRADRLGINPEKINISVDCVTEDISYLIESLKPQCVIIDSIQTLRTASSPGAAGSVGQIRESASMLVDSAKKTGIPIILIGHITKDGSIAGPKVLEHLVDTVLYFEGDYSRDFRILRAFKNRYGSVNEIGIFRMEKSGLQEVTDRNLIFTNPSEISSPGNSVSAAIEGTRCMLFEVQSLVNFTTAPNPRRMSDGFDLNRLILLNAVLEKHTGLKLSSFDVFINLSGGFTINETAADLAVAAAIASSAYNRSVPERTGIFGEITLSGEIRPVSQAPRRVVEFKSAGFDTVVLPEANMKDAKLSGFEGRLIGISNLREAVSALFGDK